jgi:hypothetical protein
MRTYRSKTIVVVFRGSCTLWLVILRTRFTDQDDLGRQPNSAPPSIEQRLQSHQLRYYLTKAAMDLTYKFPNTPPRPPIPWRHESAELIAMSASSQPALSHLPNSQQQLRSKPNHLTTPATPRRTPRQDLGILTRRQPHCTYCQLQEILPNLPAPMQSLSARRNHGAHARVPQSADHVSPSISGGSSASFFV